ncbi:unnamed protein product [Rotaria socialis]|uniref:Ig-like domain-containing protein n=1 Tax=Rotaria socialis TaxID=392032 RepID=A0A820RK60_9BILA|nr:unnamed protein product [Rotaria socialis]
MSEEKTSGSENKTNEGHSDLKLSLLMKLNDTFAFKGDRVVLQCSIKSSTSAEVKWFKNHAQLQDSDNYEQTQDNQCFELIIKRSVEDTGVYSIEVSSEIGIISSSCQLVACEDYIDVGQEQTGISRHIIVTDSVSSCFAMLIDGLFENSSFAFLKHSAWRPKDESSSLSAMELISNILIDLAELIKTNLKTSFNLPEQPDLMHITNVQMFVAGGDTLDVDNNMRDALSLLYEKSNSIEIINTITNMEDNGEILYKEEAIYLCKQLTNQITILDAATYVLPSLEEDANSIVENPNTIESASIYINYDCLIKRGLVGIAWRSPAGTFNLALMVIDLSTQDKSQYQWCIQDDEIKRVKELILNQQYDMEKLEKSLSLIPRNALYIRSAGYSSSIITYGTSVKTVNEDLFHRTESVEIFVFVKKVYFV